MSNAPSPPRNPTPGSAQAPPGRSPRARGSMRHSQGDRIALGLVLGVPALLVVGLVWLPAMATVILSFTLFFSHSATW